MTELRIHTYTAAESGLNVNSYLLETAEAVVLVDASLLVSDAQALAARLTALRKPLVAAFVTHAHPDHFNGLGDAGLLVAQRQYLLMYRETVRRLAAGALALSEAQQEELTDVMARFLPEAPLTWLVGLGADAVAAELATPVAA